MTTRKTNTSLTNLAAKKLLGKAHTSNLKDISNEPYPSNVSVVGGGVFSEVIPNSPGSNFYTVYSASSGDPGTVEKVYFKVVADNTTRYDADGESNGGSGDESSVYGPHGYYLQLASDYEASSSNPLSGSGVFVDDSVIYSSRGALQIVPPFVSTDNPNPYQLKLYNASDQEISFTDNIDWTVDYYAGTIFIQDYVESAGGISKVPVSASAYIYVGKYLDEKLSDIDTEAGNITVKDEGSIVTTSASSLNFVGSGVTATDSGGDVTVTIDAITYSRTQITSTLTSSISDRILGVSASAPLDIRLPAASGFSNGQHFVVKDEAGNANTNTITIRTTGADEIDGRTSVVLESPYAAINIYCDGSSKFFIY